MLDTTIRRKRRIQGICAPPAHYAGTLFTNATAPMLLVAIVVGGSSLLAAAAAFTRHDGSVFLSVAAGLLTIAWEVAADVVVQQFSLFFVAVGLAVIALAEYGWATEHRQPPTRKPEVVEISCVDSKVGDGLPITLALQLFWFVLGLAVLGLAGVLVTREYPIPHVHLRHARHA